MHCFSHQIIALVRTNHMTDTRPLYPLCSAGSGPLPLPLSCHSPSSGLINTQSSTAGRVINSEGATPLSRPFESPPLLLFLFFFFSDPPVPNPVLVLVLVVHPAEPANRVGNILRPIQVEVVNTGRLQLSIFIVSVYQRNIAPAGPYLVNIWTPKRSPAHL